MRRVIFHAQTTLDGRIANGDGLFWEPFPWGEPETAYVNDLLDRDPVEDLAALRLVSAKAFDAGAVVLRYAPLAL